MVPKKCYVLLCVVLYLLPLRAQLFGSFTHYSTEDGLSQNTVMNILQDRRGNMWFTTWDGLNKFDGYTFKVYKAKPDNQVELVNNRADFLYEDLWGCLWLQAYDDRVFRFNPQTEVFERVPQRNEDGRSLQIASIKVLPGGSVWLLAKHEGAIRVRTDAETLEMSSTWYSTTSGLISATQVHNVFEDADRNEWLLTDNGLAQIVPGREKEPNSFFVAKADDADMDRQPFYVAYEWKERIYFGSDKGRVWCYDKRKEQFVLMQLPGESRLVDIKPLDDDALAFVMMNDGLVVYHSTSGEMEHYGAEHLHSAPVYSIYIDRYKNIWFEQ